MWVPTLTSIALNENRFSGPIPGAELLNSPLISVLLLNNNYLTGSIPEAYCNLTIRTMLYDLVPSRSWRERDRENPTHIIAVN